MIKIYEESEIKQGTDEWLELRKNRISGTDGASILRGKTFEEILEVKRNAKPFTGNYWTKRGHILEDESRNIYSEVYEPVKTAGIITNSKYPNAIFSPDGLIGEDGLWENKSFSKDKHLQTMEELTLEIIGQTQLGLFISERKYCDLCLFNPDLPVEQAYFVKRIYPIPEIQEKFKDFFEKNLTFDQ